MAALFPSKKWKPIVNQNHKSKTKMVNSQYGLIKMGKMRLWHFQLAFLMLINFYFNHFVLRALISELFQLLWCLITAFLQCKMNFFREKQRKVLKVGSENSSSGEQFPTLSDFRSLQNFEKLSFKEELFSLPWSFRTYQWLTILFSAKV